MQKIQKVLKLVQRFYATVRCRLRHYTKASSLHQGCRGGRSKPNTRWNQIWAAGPHKSKTTQRSKRQVRKASKAPTTVQPARPLQRPASKATTKNGVQALIKAKQRKEASGKSASQIQASSDANTHNSKHKLRGGGAGKTTRAKARHKKNA